MENPVKVKKRVWEEQVVIEHSEEEGEGAKWVTHYCSDHQILLVGEGDFSFSLCLAKSFGSASNMVASSLDTYGLSLSLSPSLSLSVYIIMLNV